MGHRLHYCKTYNVEYSENAWFNYQVEEFHNLLMALDIAFTGDVWDNQFECADWEWTRGIQKLRNMDQLDPEVKADIEEAIADIRRENQSMTAERLADILQRIIDEADTSDGMVHLCFF